MAFSFTPVQIKASKDARASEWAKFRKRFPGADTSCFRTEADFDEKGGAKADVLYITGDGAGHSVFGEQGKLLPSAYMSEAMGKALGLKTGFPLALTVNPVAKHPIPAVPFSQNPQRVGGVLVKQKIWVTPTSFFNTDLRDIFTHTKIKFTSGCKTSKWLAGPNICYWPQQLSFALWCATTGCGVSWRLLFEKDTDHELHLSPQIQAFFLFHVYFTTRRILYEMGGIQSMSALPGDPTFSQTNNNYDPPSYRSICDEFGIDSRSDFCLSEGANHGLGKVFIYVSYVGPESTEYPGQHKVQ